MIRTLFQITFLFFFLSTSVYSQWDKTKKLEASDVSAPVAIVFGSLSDGFPEHIRVRGKIKDLTFSRAGCGTVAWGETLKIELTQRIDKYAGKNVFIMKGCFGDFEKFGRNKKKYLDREIEFDAFKLYPQYQFGLLQDINKVPCAFDLITNELHSEGTPFYCTRTNISRAIEEFERLNNKN